MYVRIEKYVCMTVAIYIFKLSISIPIPNIKSYYRIEKIPTPKIQYRTSLQSVI